MGDCAGCNVDYGSNTGDEIDDYCVVDDDDDDYDDGDGE